MTSCLSTNCSIQTQSLACNEQRRARCVGVRSIGSGELGHSAAGQHDLAAGHLRGRLAAQLARRLDDWHAGIYRLSEQLELRFFSHAAMLNRQNFAP